MQFNSYAHQQLPSRSLSATMQFNSYANQQLPSRSLSPTMQFNSYSNQQLPSSPVGRQASTTTNAYSFTMPVNDGEARYPPSTPTAFRQPSQPSAPAGSRPHLSQGGWLRHAHFEDGNTKFRSEAADK
eukprot:3354525-Rhodomonas_salina.1